MNRPILTAVLCLVLAAMLTSAWGATVNCNTYCEQYVPGYYHVNCLSACTACSGNTDRITGNPGSLTCCPTGYRCASGGCCLTCKEPLVDCFDNCTDLSTSPTNCGSCGNVCSPNNGAASCTSGACGISCNSGFGNCDSSVGNGCETNTNTDVNHCGTCGNSCNLPNANESCAAGACAVASCSTGSGNCDGNSTNGCEVNLSTNVSNCGMCGRVCSLPHATPDCAGGACGIAACVQGHANCNTYASDGCEISLLTNVSNCGTCGNVCPNRAHATTNCTASTCGFTCSAGWGNCNSSSTDGCETDIHNDRNNCGYCGHVCGTFQTCHYGECGY